MNNTLGSQNVTITYQFVVVAVVACGIFAAAVTTVMYRRRRRAALARWNVVEGRERTLVVRDGTFVEVPRKRKKVGPEPKLWDVVVGEEKEESDAEAEDDESQRSERGLVEKVWDDDGASCWNPTSLALAPPGNLDAMLLIAMPHPDLPFDPAQPERYAPPPSVPAMNEYGEEVLDLPDLQLGVTHLPLGPSDWDAVAELVPPKPKKKSGDKQREHESEGRRRARVDGFARAQALLRI